MVNAKAEKSVLQIKQDDKFFCRLLSKESSNSYPSFRVAAVAVPFVWESQPGTPKYKLSEDTLPPLTPPPSYHFNTTCKRPSVKKIRPSRSNNIFMALFPKLNLKRIILSTTSSSSSSSSPSPSSLSCSSTSWLSSSSDSSSKVVPVAKIGRRRFLSYGSSSFDLRGVHNEQDQQGGGGGSGSPSSTLCFGLPRAASSNSGFLSSYRRQG